MTSQHHVAVFFAQKKDSVYRGIIHTILGRKLYVMTVSRITELYLLLE